MLSDGSRTALIGALAGSDVAGNFEAAKAALAGWAQYRNPSWSTRC